ncbi:uncharacterized protein LOC110815837 [Carica papaya]|uniref:uncharacterized protein LOC110815837 n=1 Tax=Carica papaya TaxID=3649 RepID=UPI000B8C76D5|nr:uncharacterized protein LOC110815837 [Carica papaya]
MVEELVNQHKNGISGLPLVPAPYNSELAVMDPDCHRKFMRLHPPTFTGTKNFIEAEGWLKEIEKAFRVLGVTSEHKVIMATYLLVGEADHWWKFRQTTLPIPITWERFRRAFNAKYFLAQLRHQKELKFIQLTQENLLVIEYARRFTELTHFAPAILTYEGQRARKFQ